MHPTDRCCCSRHRSAGTVAMLTDGALILAAGLAVLVVCAVTSRQDRRAEPVAGDAPPAVTPVAAAEQSVGTPKSFPPPSAA